MFHLNQRGAMFGLDARVAMGIMSAISVIAGAAIFMTISNVRAGGLAKEMQEMSVAVEGLHSDLNGNVRNFLTTATDTNAFQALWDNGVLNATGQARWNGPYLRLNSNTHPTYGGAMTLERRLAADAPGSTCTTGLTCFYNIVVPGVPVDILTQLNNTVDGPNETTPRIEGLVQWSNTATTATLYYRSVRNI